MVLLHEGSADGSGDHVAMFHRPYKRIGVAKADEHRVTGVDYRHHTVLRRLDVDSA